MSENDDVWEPMSIGLLTVTSLHCLLLVDDISICMYAATAFLNQFEYAFWTLFSNAADIAFLRFIADVADFTTYYFNLPLMAAQTCLFSLYVKKIPGISYTTCQFLVFSPFISLLIRIFSNDQPYHSYVNRITKAYSLGVLVYVTYKLDYRLQAIIFGLTYLSEEISYYGDSRSMRASLLSINDLLYTKWLFGIKFESLQSVLAIPCVFSTLATLLFHCCPPKLKMSENSSSRILCHTLLAAEVVNLATALKNKSALGFAVAALSIRTLHGFSVIADEVTEENSSISDLKNFATKLSLTIGFPLFATQIAYNAIHEPWMPLLNLAVPATDLILYYTMDERPFSDEVFQITKLISVGCVIYAAMKTDETLGYIAAVAYILAEFSVHNEDYGEAGWCFTSAIGDYLSTLILFGSLFGYSKGELS